MAYKVIILYRLYMPSYFLGTFTEYPELKSDVLAILSRRHAHLLFEESSKKRGIRKIEHICNFLYVFLCIF